MTWFSQRSTLLGLALACGGITAWVYLPHQTILHALSAVLSPILIIVSDERFHRIAVWVIDIGPKVLLRLRPSTSSSPVTTTQEHPEMSVVTTITEILAEAPDFLKLVEDGSAVFADVKTKGVLAGFADLQKFEPDLVKVYNDIKALGVSQAVAAGTVVAAPVS